MLFLNLSTIFCSMGWLKTRRFPLITLDTSPRVSSSPLFRQMPSAPASKTSTQSFSFNSSPVNISTFRFGYSSLRRKYSGEDFRKHFTKSVSIVASISYDTFVLYLHVFSEYVRRVPKRPKYSPTVTIWLQKDEPNKNCNQEYVQRLFRVLICCCYSNDYVELCSGIYGSSFHPFRR